MKMKRIYAALTIPNSVNIPETEIINRLMERINLEVINATMKSIDGDYSKTYRVEVMVGSLDDYFADLNSNIVCNIVV